ncbi:hypothetical protein EOI86_08450 [Hwanghaeella grinnelliae]|uniref:Uncharacterized protein n=1 Tax=Hwanghaeella grinnelliae TaxID=2500179 RepID=A0A3S2VT66_9PROT|nr:hypothetical protein [Hwanghaeella grinnelliae]RVU39257.1 hypothetical protein EOI86_08450 [Hwanghaeella grinnelliae]
MTGQSHPKYRTDDIRQTFGALRNTRLFKTVVTAVILLVALALLIRSFGFGGTTEDLCDVVLNWGTAVFAVEVSLLMIAQRVAFFGKIGNAALFLITGIALFTPFDFVLMLRLFPLLTNGVYSRRLPRPLALAITPFWLVACLAAAARDYVMFENMDCAGWADCITTASSLAMP